MFDMIIYVTDICHGFQDKAEYYFFEKIFQLINKNNIYLVCLLNKCDNMVYDENENDIIFENVSIAEVVISTFFFLKDERKTIE